LQNLQKLDGNDIFEKKNGQTIMAIAIEKLIDTDFDEFINKIDKNMLQKLLCVRKF